MAKHTFTLRHANAGGPHEDEITVGAFKPAYQSDEAEVTLMAHGDIIYLGIKAPGGELQSLNIVDEQGQRVGAISRAHSQPPVEKPEQYGIWYEMPKAQLPKGSSYTLELETRDTAIDPATMLARKAAGGTREIG